MLHIGIMVHSEDAGDTEWGAAEAQTPPALQLITLYTFKVRKLYFS